MLAPLARSDAARLGRLRARFDAYMLKLSSGDIGSRADAITRGRVRYIQILVHRLCEGTDEPVPEWANLERQLPARSAPQIRYFAPTFDGTDP